MKTDDASLKTHDILLLVLFAMFFVFGLLSFFLLPKDASIAMKVVEGIGIAIGDVLAFKFGIHQAQAAQSNQSEAKPDPPPAA